MSPLLVTLMVATAPQNATYTAEAERLTKATIAAFYDPVTNTWRPPVPTSESVGTQGYTFWASLVAWQAVIEAAKVTPKAWKDQIGTYFGALEPYFDRSGHAYCAWKYFPGNDDHFYDDNTWAAIACMEAYEVTNDRRYRERAIDIFDNFVKGGWDERAGGLRWGTKIGPEDRSDHTVSATAAGALAALLIAKSRTPDSDLQWAKRALDWIHKNLSQPNHLILDGIKRSGEIMPTVWTYNTGVPIRAAVEYSRQTGDTTIRAWAIRMGNAAIDRSLTPLYDGAVADESKRYWYDATYFVQFLVDGLRSLNLETGDRKYLIEAQRNADYVRNYLRDRDGLYWRSMRLWRINEDRTAAFTALTGRTIAPNFDPSERSMGAEELSKPVERRRMVKTLLANAGVARMFWLLSH